ncbi:MAG: aspartyl/asparaginyl beta-hydroxylase domain-containing protein [Alphaproteobacteria bacterium]
MTLSKAEIDEGMMAADRALAQRNAIEARAILEAMVAQEPNLPEYWQRLATVRHVCGASAAAIAAIDKALEFSPLHFVNLLMRARILDQMNHPDAGEAYGRALAQPRPDPLPLALAGAIDRAETAWAEHKAGLEKRLAAALEDKAIDLTPTERRRAERLASNISRRTKVYHSEATHFQYPGLREVEFHDRKLFPWLEQLEAMTDTIAHELDIVANAADAELVPYVQYNASEPLAQWRALNHNRDWTAIHLIDRGQQIRTNVPHCPQTMEFLASVPQPWIDGCGANAMFSLLAPRTSIPAHVGVANFRLLCHLPLIIPGKCWFRVGEEVRTWERGRAWVFDDSIEHEAANETDHLRVIMIFDIWHPDLSPAEQAAIATMVGSASMPAGAL